MRACRVCKSSKCHLAFVSKEYKGDKLYSLKVIKCQECGLLFVESLPSSQKLNSYYQNDGSVPSRDFKRLKKKIERLNTVLRKFILKEFYGYNIATKRNTFKRIISFVLSQFTLKDMIPFKGEGKILDLGCGGGLYLKLLKELGWEVYGVEIDSHSCEVAKSLGINIFCGQLKDAKFADEFFDVIRLNHVLEHVPFPKETFEEIKRILKPEGAVYLISPNSRSLASWCFKSRWLGMGHLYGFSPSTIDRLCKEVGLYPQKWGFKSSKGIIKDSIKYLLEDLKWQRASEIFVKKWKSLRVFVSPLVFLLNYFHLSDTLMVKIVKKAHLKNI